MSWLLPESHELSPSLPGWNVSIGREIAAQHLARSCGAKSVHGTKAQRAPPVTCTLLSMNSIKQDHIYTGNQQYKSYFLLLLPAIGKCCLGDLACGQGKGCSTYSWKLALHVKRFSLCNPPHPQNKISPAWSVKGCKYKTFYPQTWRQMHRSLSIFRY